MSSLAPIGNISSSMRSISDDSFNDSSDSIGMEQYISQIDCSVDDVRSESVSQIPTPSELEADQSLAKKRWIRVAFSITALVTAAGCGLLIAGGCEMVAQANGMSLIDKPPFAIFISGFPLCGFGFMGMMMCSEPPATPSDIELVLG